MEEYVADLLRHSLIARVQESATGVPFTEIPALYDVTLLRWTTSIITLTGIEQLVDDCGLKVL